MSQERLAAALDRTPQQLQKYERGDNRISASVLYEASKVLGAPIGWFFEGADDTEPGRVGSEGQVSAFWSTAEGQLLLNSIPRIDCPALRAQVIGVIAALAKE